MLLSRDACRVTEHEPMNMPVLSIAPCAHLAIFTGGPNLHNHHPLPSLKRSGPVSVNNTSKR